MVETQHAATIMATRPSRKENRLFIASTVALVKLAIYEARTPPKTLTLRPSTLGTPNAVRRLMNL